MKSTRCLIVVAGLLMLAGSVSVNAQDPLKVNPKTVGLRVDNDRVRVLEARLAPGDKEQMHSHPPYVIYVISGGKALDHTADGKTTEMALSAGDVVYRDATRHWAENVGTTEIHLILIELKTSQSSVLTAQTAAAPDAVKLSPQFYTIRIDNDRVRVVEYRLKPGQREPMHTHLAGVAYVIGPAKLRTTFADGASVDGTLGAGDVHWREQNVVHSVENIGNTEAHALIVELKEEKAAQKAVSAIALK